MTKKPNDHFAVLPEAYFQECMSKVEAQLSQCKTAGNFSGFDGRSLYYEYFRSENSHGAVVVVHGLSEFSEKYHEFAWYMLEHGYDVFLYDQRCHGRSCRLTDQSSLIHVDHFSHYRKDLHRFICDVVQPATSKPLYLYGHSMGGAVVAQYLAEHPDIFQKAVLSAPMIQPLTGSVPASVARWGLGLYVLFGNGKKKCFTSNEYDPNYPFERSQDQSRARFLWNMDNRHRNPCYCTTPQTFRWVHQALCVRSQLTSKTFLKKIRTPILMICGEFDKIVSAKAQQEFAQNCPLCQHIVLPDATHSMLGGTEQTIAAHMQLVLNHFV